MSANALETFLIRLATEPDFARRWADASPRNPKDEDRREAILDAQGIAAPEKKLILEGHSNAIEAAIFGSAASGRILESSQHSGPGTVTINITVQEK